MIKQLVSLFLFTIITTDIFAQVAGTPDSTFGTTGIVKTWVGGAGSSGGFGIALQADGKTIAVGCGDFKFTLVRYKINGVIDSSFGTNGIVKSQVGGSNSGARAVTLQNDGKILVTGDIYASISVVRYKTNGTIDSTFGSNGLASKVVGTTWMQRANAIALQPNGKIILAGYSAESSASGYMVLVRFNSNGTLDNTFGTGGVVTTLVGGISGTNGIKIQPDGKIVTAGWTYNGTDNDITVARYNTNGSLDATFGTNGIAITPVGLNDEGSSLAFQTNGKVVLAGVSDNNFVLLQYNATGTLDSSFGTNGKVITSVALSNNNAYAIAIQTNGKIVVAGKADFDSGIVRYNTDGTLDITFGTGGKTITSVSAIRDNANAIALQPDGKIIVVGQAQNITDGGYSFGLVRYNPCTKLPILLSGNTLICQETSTSLSASGANNYLWQPCSGLNTCTGAYVIANPTSTTSYTLTGTDMYGCSSSKNVAIIIDSNCVWPGDANSDLVANNIDLLAIGIGYGKTGPVRTNSSNNWIEQAADKWADTLANGVNYKHIDCNGDGIINDDDTLAINLNYGQTHLKTNTQFPYVATNPDLHFVTSKTQYAPGEWVDAEIWMGNNTLPVSKLYGVVFDLNYNYNLIEPGTVSLSYPNSWLGNPGTNSIKISKIDALSGIANGAIIRTNHTNASGFGKIAVLRFQTKTSVSSSSVFHFTFSNYTAIDSVGNLKSLNVISDSVTINPALSIIKEFDSSGFSIFPNPYNSSTQINYSLPYSTHINIEIYNSIGQKIETVVNENQQQGKYQYIISQKESGHSGKLYFLKFTVDSKTYVERLIQN